MRFIVKVAFWLGLVLVLIPHGGESEPRGETVVPPQILYTAGEVARDLSGFCGRKPDACQSGHAVLKTIGISAREGARIAYEALDTHLASDGQKPHTGGIGGGAN